MLFRREVLDGVAIVTLQIQVLDERNASRVVGLVAEATRDDAHIVLDLGSLEYFDVSGFAALLKWAIAGPSQPVIAVCSRSGAIRALLELVQADSFFALYHCREDALAALGTYRSSAAADHRHSPQLSRRHTA